MKKVYLVFLIILIFIPVSFYIFSKHKVTEESFLKKNYAPVNINENDKFKSLKLMDSVVKHNEVFLNGEEHGVSINPGLEFMYIKYLKSKTDIFYK